MEDIVAALSALERNFKMHAERAMLPGGSPYLNVLPSIDQKMNRAELLHAIGDSFGRAAIDLRQQAGTAPMFDLQQAERS